MKILNARKKLKFSKMFIDEKVYREICDKYGVSLELHLARIDATADKEPVNIDFYNQDDLKIMVEVYGRITKVVRGDEKKWKRQSKQFKTN